MCTLILARDVLGPRTVLLGANRDERPARPSLPPGVLAEQPRVVGGKDQVAGGTWLALREGGAAVALLNRHDPLAHDPPKDRRSRGLLALDVATAPRHPLEEAMLAGVDLKDPRFLFGAGWNRLMGPMGSAIQSMVEANYAPFSLIYASPTSCWMLAHDGSKPSFATISAGWHVLTHADLDDPSEPRTAHLLARLASERPESLAVAEARLSGLLRSHGENGEPPVCLHDGVMVTVSSSLVWIDERGMRYLHAEGRPCEHEYRDLTPLLAGAAEPGGRT